MRLGIIGAGPGGYTAALVGASKGLECILFEKNDIGGTCLNRGCIPTKALLASAHVIDKIKKAKSYGIEISDFNFNIDKINERKNNIVTTLRTNLENLITKKKIRIIKEQAKIKDPKTIIAGDEEIKCDSIIIATGSEPLEIWKDKSIINSTEALNLKEIPSSMLIVGAGAVGLEFACFFSSMGTKVTVVEAADHILPTMDKEITDTLTRELKKRGIKIKVKCKTEKIENGKATFSDGKEETFDKILSAIGRKYNNTNLGIENTNIKLERGRIIVHDSMETDETGIYAIGDIAYGYPLLAHVASYQAITAIKNICGEKCSFEGNIIPACIFTSPEVASVGLNEYSKENLQSIKLPIRVLGRAHAEGEIAGMIKAITEDGKIKGIHIIGERASDLIAEGAVLAKYNSDVNEISEVIHAHPTFAEIYAELFHLGAGMPIHG